MDMQKRPSLAAIIIGLLFLAFSCEVRAKAGDWHQWRGPRRDGKSEDTGLLKQWPQGGPRMLWFIEGLGDGWASVSIVDGSIYTTGAKGKVEFVHAIDLDGQRKWQSESGPAWRGSSPGARCTPTYDDGCMRARAMGCSHAWTPRPVR